MSQDFINKRFDEFTKVSGRICILVATTIASNERKDAEKSAKKSTKPSAKKQKQANPPMTATADPSNSEDQPEHVPEVSSYS
ncbi:hypothetical protein CONPUDRAFT_160387 [Coniophora puteana RWD-64-598 SS2]|uniref:Uncharacterized protein n=1 Tax=Coniophora puteana (strain RWD-64-598) TaxID=741705 RepID=R7SE51_CONPW|nr:uncharacterized protein CONPUDRAFT_160387 [Coniophora puteana RWD-64-598 SS2]EIW74135.1 hypothetical protein CONPUDRAFT_160387 [Coniophora puteana RWD-64-598 SS2]